MSKPALPKALRPRKKPAQRRSRRTVTNPLLSAARVLEEWGSAAFTTNAVAERAGISVGSLYPYFPSKEALSAALIEEAQAERIAGLAEQIELALKLPLEPGVRLLVRGAIAGQTTRPLLARALVDAEADARPEATRPPLEERVTRALLGYLLLEPSAAKVSQWGRRDSNP